MDHLHESEDSSAHPGLASFDPHDHSGLDLDFSFLDQPLSSSGFGVDISNKPFGSGAAHDDACVDRCASLGLYNAPSIFHHKGPASTSHPRGRHSLAHVDYPFYPAQLPSAFSAASIVGAHSHIPHQPSFGLPNSIQEADFDFSRPRGALLPLEEDDTRSHTSTCHSGSDCNEAGCCDGTSCVNEETACTDDACALLTPGAAVSSAEAVAVVALTSIGVKDQPQPFDYLSHHDFDAMDFSQHDIPDANALSGLLSPDAEVQDYLAQHLLEEHGKTQSCIRPCLIDSRNNFSECHFGHFFYGGFPQLPSQQSSLLSTGFNQVADQHLRRLPHSECGAKIGDPDAFIKHFNIEHRPFLDDDLWANPTAPGLLHPHSTEPSPGLSSGASHTLDSSSPLTLPLPATPPTLGTRHSSTQTSRHTSHAPPAKRSRTDSGLAASSRCLWQGTGDSVCGKSFGDPTSLYKHVLHDHIKTLKRGPKGFFCAWEGCNRGHGAKDGFPQRSKIERHLQTHIEHKPHVCETCGQKFSAKQALDQHVLIHTEEKPLVCDWEGCNKRFRQQSALTMHKRTHTGAKPLKCDICGKCFSESSNLSKHKRTHEKGRYPCDHPDCDKNFRRLDQLRRHKKQHMDGESVCTEDSDRRIL